jgi:DNA (cytosine-5)-methyltransferase 1
MLNKLNHLGLFAGILGFELAAHWAGWKTVAVSEIDPYCCELIKLRMPGVPNLGDIKNYKEWEIEQPIDIITGGFPCQPVSQAGKRRGTEDDRWLWEEMLGVIKKFKPTYVIGENVAGLINMGLDEVCTSLEMEGYEVQPIIIPACAKNAPHRRDRVWIVGYSNNPRSRTSGSRVDGSRPACSEEREFAQFGTGGSGELNSNTSQINDRRHNRIQEEGQVQQSGNCDESDNAANSRGSESGRVSSIKWKASSEIGEGDKNVTNSSNEGLQGEFKQNGIEGEKIRNKQPSRLYRTWERNWVEVATRLCRMDDGLSTFLDRLNDERKRLGTRTNRLKGLGNAIVPQIAYEIMKAINRSRNDS